jgi:hypothetical protein
MNFMILIKGAEINCVDSDGNVSGPPSWVWPIVISGLLFGAFIYWLILWILAQKSDEHSLLEVRIVKDGMPVQDRDKPALQKAKVEGNSRIVVYEVGDFSSLAFGCGLVLTNVC